MDSTALLGVALIIAAAIALFFVTRKPADAPKPAPKKPEAAPKAAEAPQKPLGSERPAKPVHSEPPPPPPMPVRPKRTPIVREEYLDGALDNDDTAPNSWILVTGVGRTDPGMKRKHNEDAYLVLDDHHLFAVADGMGRHKAGEIASRLAVEIVGEAFATGDFGDSPFQKDHAKEENRLRACFDLANKGVLEQSEENEDYQGMGTTMVALHFSHSKERAAIAHAGDSRCYRYRDGELVQLTTDHTLGAAGIVGPSANVLSRAVGIEPNLEPEVQLVVPQPGDTFLICSDGLSRMATSDQIRDIIAKTADLDQAAAALIDVANKAGGRDNVTVILVRVERAKIE